jgi:hypothetical protein
MEVHRKHAQKMGQVGKKWDRWAAETEFMGQGQVEEVCEGGKDYEGNKGDEREK